MVVVTESLARAAWPNMDPLGRCLIPFERGGRCHTVVGVTNDFHQWAVVEAPPMRYILSMEQMAQPRPGASQMYVRANPDFADAVTNQVRGLVREIMPTARVLWLSRLSHRLENEVRPWRVGAGLFIALGGLARVVATIGVCWPIH